MIVSSRVISSQPGRFGLEPLEARNRAAGLRELRGKLRLEDVEAIGRPRRDGPLDDLLALDVPADLDDLLDPELGVAALGQADRALLGLRQAAPQLSQVCVDPLVVQV